MLDEIAEDVALLILCRVETKLRLRLSIVSKAYKQLVQESFYSEIVLNCNESQASQAFGWLDGTIVQTGHSLRSFKSLVQCRGGMLTTSGRAPYSERVRRIDNPFTSLQLVLPELALMVFVFLYCQANPARTSSSLSGTWIQNSVLKMR